MSAPHTLALCVLFNLINNLFPSSGPATVQSDHNDKRSSVPVEIDLMFLDGKNIWFTQQKFLHVAKLFLNLHTGERSNIYSPPFLSVLYLCGLGNAHILKLRRSLGSYCWGRSPNSSGKRRKGISSRNAD